MTTNSDYSTHPLHRLTKLLWQRVFAEQCSIYAANATGLRELIERCTRCKSSACPR